MRGFRRAQLRGSDELFRPTEDEPDGARAAAAEPERAAVTAVPAAPSPDMRSVRLSEEQIQLIADALQHMKFPAKTPARPSIGDFEKLEQLRQRLLDTI
ncbi:MAG: hypothetical protein ACREN2_06315 [Candidatus Dormibacteria bacterium]